MDITQITPLIITWNEAANLERCLERLHWASQIIVLDSGSSDATTDICRNHASVRLLTRTFDSFSSQCNFGLDQVQTEWVLSLDADYLVPHGFDGILKNLSAGPDGYQLGFNYCIYGRPLTSSLYPARTVLYRARNGRYADFGHGHRLQLNGVVNKLPSRIDHDDRKPISRWLDSQRRYAVQEAEHLSTAEIRSLPLADRIRCRIWLAVPAVFLYVLLWKRCLFDGWPGWYYVLQRTYAELLLSLELLDRKLRTDTGQAEKEGEGRR